MKKISKKHNLRKFNQVISLPGWINQKDENITSESLFKRTSINEITINDAGFNVFMTSGYWFDLDYDKVDSELLKNILDHSSEKNSLFNLVKDQKLKVSSTAPRQSNAIVNFNFFRFSAYKVGIGFTNVITHKDEIFWLQKKNDLNTQFKELFEIL